MTRPRAVRGSMLVAPLVAAAVGLAALAGVAALLSQAARWIRRANVRVEAHDTADLVAQAFAFDLRRAGWSPTGTTVARLTHAAADAFEVHADLDGDGVVDPTSAERLRWAYAPARRTVSRLVGDQAMPLASIVSDFELAYLDDAGMPLAPGVTGLPAADLDRVRAVVAAFRLADPTGGVPVQRTVAVALRGAAW
jgi:hypothetical protein